MLNPYAKHGLHLLSRQTLCTKQLLKVDIGIINMLCIDYLLAFVTRVLQMG